MPVFERACASGKLVRMYHRYQAWRAPFPLWARIACDSLFWAVTAAAAYVAIGNLGADLDELSACTPRSGLHAPVGQPGQPFPLLNHAMHGAFIRTSYEVCGRRFSARRPPSPPALPAAG